MKNQQ